MLNNEAQKCSIESTTSTTTEWKRGGISRAKPLMTNADQASVRLSGRADCRDFQHSVRCNAYRARAFIRGLATLVNPGHQYPHGDGITKTGKGDTTPEWFDGYGDRDRFDIVT